MSIRMKIPASAVFVSGGLALLPVYFILGGAAQDSVYDVFNAAAVVAIVIGVRRHRPRDAWGWYLLAASQAMFALGDIAYNVMENVLNQAAPFPSVADLFYLAAYPLATAAMIRFTSPLGTRGTRGALTDAGLVTTAFASVAWLALVGPYVADATMSDLQRLISIAYPVMDLLVVVVGARLLFASPRRPRAYDMLLAAYAVHCVTDWSYAVMVLGGSYHSGVLIDAGWLVAAILVGAAALDPSMSARIAKSDAVRSVSVRRLAVLAGASLVAPVCIAIDAATRDDLDVWMLASAAIVTVVLALVRLRGLTQESSRLRTELVQRERWFEALVHNASDVFVVVGADGTIEYESPAADYVLGESHPRRVGRPLVDLVHPDDAGAIEEQLRELMSAPGRQALSTCRVRHASGAWRSVEGVATNLLAETGVEGIVVNYRDVTEEMALQAELKRQAFHDALTGLPNRALFINRLEHALARSERGRTVAVLFIDLDDFKTVNDGLGHAVGDELLTLVGARLAGTLRAGDTLARLGGDEFAVITRDVGGVSDAQRVADRIHIALAQPFDVAARDARIGASLGVAVANSPKQGAIDLMRNADVAMYTAKQRGKGRSEVFLPTMQLAAYRRLDLMAALQDALAGEEFVIEYQPVVELASGTTAGVEALVRWQDPKRGKVLPSEFIPLAVETGLIVPIGQWVLTEACRQVREWQRASSSQEHIKLNVNVSVRQLQHPELVSQVEQALRSSGLAPGDLVLEITESDLMLEVEAGILQLHHLKALGVQLAIDDFGTGYSSLAYLRRFPVDIVKIDRSFIDAITKDAEAAALAHAMIHLGQTLGMVVVAEGIETPEQADILRQWGCDIGQGFHFSRPVAPHLIQQRLDDEATRAGMPRHTETVAPRPRRVRARAGAQVATGAAVA